MCRWVLSFFPLLFTLALWGGSYHWAVSIAVGRLGVAVDHGAVYVNDTGLFGGSGFIRVGDPFPSTYEDAYGRREETCALPFQVFGRSGARFYAIALWALTIPSAIFALRTKPWRRREPGQELSVEPVWLALATSSMDATFILMAVQSAGRLVHFWNNGRRGWAIGIPLFLILMVVAVRRLDQNYYNRRRGASSPDEVPRVGVSHPPTPPSRSAPP